MLNIARVNMSIRASRNAAVPEKDQRTKIGLLCELTNENVGNAAFEAAAIQHLLEYYPDAEIYFSARDLLETFKSREVRPFPLNMPKHDLVVASRMHQFVLSQLMHRPVLAIFYDDEVNSLMAGLGLLEFCLDIRKIGVSALIERFDALELQRDIVTQARKGRVAEYREALEQQYDWVFGS